MYMRTITTATQRDLGSEQLQHGSEPPHKSTSLAFEAALESQPETQPES